MINVSPRLSEACRRRQGIRGMTLDARDAERAAGLDRRCAAAYRTHVRTSRAAVLGPAIRHGLVAFALASAAARSAEADPPPAAPVTLAPPRQEAAFVEFGVALGGEVAASTGGLCPSDSRVPCIFGSGGGLTTRAGYRFASPLYLGGAYEFSKQDSKNLLRLAILQQLRFEARYLLDTVSRYEPFVTAGVGVAGYGNEWSVDTWGPTGFVGIGLETQLSRTSIFDVALVYRP
jgi:hypothetical protein